MPRILPCALLCAASLSATTPAFAWMSEPARNPDNGHYYAFFNGKDDDNRFSRPAMPFADALARAASMSHLGVRGHLATITSQAEQDFILKDFRDPGRPRFGHPTEEDFWIAASDAAVEGEWRWVAGPEAGQMFWQGRVDRPGYITGQSFGYQNWLGGRTNGGDWVWYEPNNEARGGRPGGEDYGSLTLRRGSTTLPSFWNDVIGLDDRMQWSPRLAIVEFSVPEPSSGALIATAGSMLVAACRRQAKSATRR